MIDADQSQIIQELLHGDNPQRPFRLKSTTKYLLVDSFFEKDVLYCSLLVDKVSGMIFRTYKELCKLAVTD